VAGQSWKKKILKISRENVEGRAQRLSEILLHLGEKARWLLLQDEFYNQRPSLEQQERMSSILNDFHSLKENQQPESGIPVQHSQVQQSSASLQPESGVLVQHRTNFNTYSPVQTAQRS